MPFEVRLNVPDSLRNAPERIDEELKIATNDATALVNNSAVDNAPRKYGTLKRSIHPEVVASVGRFTGKVIQDSSVAKYGIYQELGTGIYGPKGEPITPKTAPFLQWKGYDGQWRRAKSVKGVQPKYFMKRALTENKEKIEQIYRNRINKVIGGE